MSDLISREAAIEAIESHLRVGDEVYPLTRTDEILNHAFEIAASCVYNLPAVEKVGKWERKWHTLFRCELYCCSTCGHFEPLRCNYCPNCGARMEEEAVSRIDDDPSHPFADGVMMKE